MQEGAVQWNVKRTHGWHHEQTTATATDQTHLHASNSEARRWIAAQSQHCKLCRTGRANMQRFDLKLTGQIRPAAAIEVIWTLSCVE